MKLLGTQTLEVDPLDAMKAILFEHRGSIRRVLVLLATAARDNVNQDQERLKLAEFLRDHFADDRSFQIEKEVGNAYLR